MRVIGIVNSVRELPSRDGDVSSSPLLSYSIEGFSCLISADRLPPDAPKGGEVEVVVSVRWPRAGGRPSHWIEAIRAIPYFSAAG